MTSPIVRAFVLGVATGGRSSVAPAALVWGAPAVFLGRARGRGRVPGWLTGRAAHVLTGLMVGGEAVADKLPATPSRLIPRSLGFRLVSGAGAGALLARRGGTALLPALAAGAVGAAAGSFGGAKWRALATARFGRDLYGALIEDAAVAGLAAAVR